jgi:RHS repeat-associated protein
MRMKRTVARTVGWLATVALAASTPAAGSIAAIGAVAAVAPPATGADAAVAAAAVAAPPPGGLVPSVAGFGKTPGSFSVSGDGAAHYSVPIWVPDGRGTVEPQLSLSYDSRGGNGLVGVGWSLGGLSSVAPCAKTVAQDGHTDGVAFDASDAYCLGGARLVPTTALPPPPNGQFWEREYRTEQESFTRVIAYGQVVGTTPRYFKAWTKDGKILTFGNTADSRRQAFKLTAGPEPYTLVRESTDRVTVAWDVNRVEDRNGNAATVEYERLEGSSTQLWHSQSRPKAIKYAPNREVRFAYGGRPDPIESYGRGVHLLEDQRLSKVLVLGGPQGGEIELLRQYLLTYDDESPSITQRSLLDSITACDGANRCMKPIRFSWSKGSYDVQAIDTTINDGGQYLARGYPGFPEEPEQWAVDNQIVVGDYDGDGRDDILYPNTDTILRTVDNTDDPALAQQKWFVRLSNGSGFGSARPAGFAPPKHDCFSPPPGRRPGECTASRGRVQPIDVDLDGRLEVMVFVPVTAASGRWRLYTFNGTAFVPHSSRLESRVEQDNFPDPVIFADLDGNGTPDLVTAPEDHRAWDEPHPELATVDGSWTYRLNTGKAGTQRFAPAVDTGRQVPARPSMTRVVDANADGRADLVGGGGWGLGPAGQVEARQSPFSNDPLNRYAAADVNGDGLEDVVSPFTVWREDIPTPKGRLTAALSAGTGVAPRSTSPTNYWEPQWHRIPPPPPDGEPEPEPTDYGYNRGVHYVDFNGDGADDVLVFRGGKPSTTDPTLRGAQLYVWRNGRFEWAPLNREAGSWGPGGLTGSRALDIDGDGVLDILHVQDDLDAPDDEPKGHLRILKRTGGIPDRLVGVSGTGRERVEIDYASIADSSVHSPVTTCDYPQVCLVKGGTVVSEHRTWTFATTGGDAGWDRFTHTYVGAKADTQGRGWLGFSSHVLTRTLTGAQTFTAFDNTTRDDAIDAYPFAGLPREVTTNVNDSPTGRRHQSDSLTEYDVRRHPGGGYSVEPTTVTAMERERPVSGGPWQTLRENTTTSLFDDYGNVALSTSVTTGGRTVVTDPTYRNDTGNWLLGLATRTTVRACTKDAVCTTRTTTADYDDRGRQTLAVVEPDAPDPADLRLRTVTAYDPFGNVTSVTRSDAAGNSRKDRAEYGDADKVHPTATFNAAEHQTVVETHSGLGVPLSTTDPNGVVTTMRYDGFGRLRGTFHADGSSETIDHSVVLQSEVTTTSTAGGGQSSTSTDPLGRPNLSQVTAFDGSPSSVSTYYDPLGRATLVSRPRAAGETARYTTTVYDNLDRPVSVTAPDGVVVRHTYLNRETHSYDGRGTQSFTVTNADGEIESRSEDDPASTGWLQTRYVSGPFGEPKRVTAVDDTVQVMEYDILGRRTKLTDPNTGVTKTEYNAFGEPTTETDGNGRTTTSGYDRLGRTTTTTSPDGTATNVWDTAAHGKGLLAKATSTDGVVTVNTYTEHGKPETSTWTVEGTGYQIGYGYDQFGRQAQITYPAIPGASATSGQLKVGYGYNAAGYLSQVRDPAAAGPVYWTAETRNHAGQLTRERHGNGTLQNRRYDDRTGLLQTIEDTGRGLLRSTSYGYDANRNVTSRQSSEGRLDEYGYDTLNRLKTWELTANGANPTTSFSYDEIGNLKTETVSGETPGQPQRDTTYTYPVNGVRPHTLVERNGATYTYDDAGRQVTGDGRTVTYNQAGLPRSMTWGQGQRTDFRYDAAGTRVLKRDGSNTLVTIGGLFERRNPAGTGSTQIHNLHNIVADGRVVAQVNRVQTTPTGSPADPVVTYIHTDLQGSTTLVTNQAGRPADDDESWLREIFYDPFGRRVAADGTPLGDQRRGGPHQGYTGHEHDDELGLVNMKGRVYDPGQRRFLTPDSVVPDPLSGQDYNRYAYVTNNPVTLVDPTGHAGLTAEMQANSSYAEGAGTNTKVPIGAMNKALLEMGPMTRSSVGGGRIAALEGALQDAVNSYVGNGGPGDLNATPNPETRSDGDTSSRGVDGAAAVFDAAGAGEVALGVQDGLSAGERGSSLSRLLGRFAGTALGKMIKDVDFAADVFGIPLAVMELVQAEGAQDVTVASVKLVGALAVKVSWAVELGGSAVAGSSGATLLRGAAMAFERVSALAFAFQTGYSLGDLLDRRFGLSDAISQALAPTGLDPELYPRAVIYDHLSKNLPISPQLRILLEQGLDKQGQTWPTASEYPQWLKDQLGPSNGVEGHREPDVMIYRELEIR